MTGVINFIDIVKVVWEFGSYCAVPGLSDSVPITDLVFNPGTSDSTPGKVLSVKTASLEFRTSG